MYTNKANFYMQIEATVCDDYYVDASDERGSNWMRYMNCSKTENEANITAYQCKEKIYFITKCKIKPGDELVVWYGHEFAVALNLCTDSNEVNTWVYLIRKLYNQLDQDLYTNTKNILYMTRFGVGAKCIMGFALQQSLILYDAVNKGGIRIDLAYHCSGIMREVMIDQYVYLPCLPHHKE